MEQRRPLASSAHALIVGAGQGIGLGLVQQLLARPHFSKVYATYRQPDRAIALLNLAQGNPQRLETFPLDITDEGAIAQRMDQIHRAVQHLHTVIYCVGWLHDGPLQPEKSLKHLQSEQLLRYFQVNSIGAALLAKHLVPLLRHGEPSTYAAISAKVGSIGDNFLGGWYGYRASKAALNMFMRNIALEYRRTSPKTLVVCLHPGTTDTRLSQPFQSHVPPEKLFSVERTATQLLAVLEGLKEEDSGEFFSWDGSPLPW